MRTAFQASFAHEHRTHTSRISSVAVADDGKNLYLGLSDGQLEEHTLVSGLQCVRVTLQARKHVGKQPVESIYDIPAARRLAVLCDGMLILLDKESLEGQAVPGLKGVTAIAPYEGEQWGGARLAVATRSSKRSIRVMVWEVLPGADITVSLGAAALCEAQAELAEPLTVKAVAWLGSNLLVCTALRAMLLQLPSGTYSQIFALQPDSPSALLVQSIPAAQQAVLLVDQAGIIIDGNGHPTGTALTFPTTPGAIVAAGMHVLAACSDAMHVYDRQTAAHVQSLPYMPGAQPNPGQRLLTACNPRGACICLAGQRKVWLYMPVALEEQVQQVLRAGDYGQALALAGAGAATGAPWAEIAFAQTGLLLLHELRWQEAIQALLRCSVTTFQPLELFPLFPQVTASWAHLQPLKHYWHLHQPLQDLPALVHVRLHSVHPIANGRTSQAEEEDELFAVADAQKFIATYLLKVRRRDGVEALDGVDTLAIHLLALLGWTTELDRLAAGSSGASLESVAPLLQQQGQWHSLAMLSVARGRPEDALQIWKDLVEERKLSLPASPSGRGAVASHVTAVEHYTNLLAQDHLIPDALALQHLPWLLNTAPQHASSLLKARPLNMAEVLALLRMQSKAVLEDYLLHQLVELQVVDPALHTELVMLLAETALSLMHAVDPSMPAWERAKFRRTQTLGDLAAQQLGEARAKLNAAMHASEQWDATAVLQLLQGTDLWEERVLVHNQLGDHTAALAVLALEMGDIRGAEQYCEQQAGPSERLALLRMLLSPGHGREPLYTEACHLLAAQGADLDPQEVLQALGEGMPLAVAAPTLERMLRERVHRMRQGTMLKHLHRAANLTTASQRAQLMSKRLTATEERACRICHARLGTRVFAAYPNGVLVCFKCFSQSSPHICPVTGQDFELPAIEPVPSQEKWPD